uniref:Aldedh domain-containing protein n=1 Tax=Rhabditophanes sp. KR3021 TaxID=114890 RepID=A0AC35U9V9_9BILA
MALTKECIAYLLDTEGSELKFIKNFIGNKFYDTKKHIVSENPATGKGWINVPDSHLIEANMACDAAFDAFKSWSNTSIGERSRLLNKVADIIEENLDGYAKIESKDQGKPIVAAMGMDIPRAVHNFRFFASAVLHHVNPSSTVDTPVRSINYVKSDAIGVACLISPWNLPLYLLTFKLAPALACGNTVVAKPSEMTSATAYVLAHTFLDAGFPPGVVNILFGNGPNVGEPILTHPKVHLISFTGSTVVGKKIAELAAPAVKKVSLEMGGKNAAIIFPSVNIQKIAPIIARSCFFNQGQICLCTSRLLIHADIFAEFVRALSDEAEKITVGDPEQPNVCGALVSKVHFNKVASYIKHAESASDHVIIRGGIKTFPKGHKCADGYFISPTIVTCPIDSKLMQEEIFGPVVCCIPFNNQQEAIDIANDTAYGLSATVWSTNTDELHQTAHQLRVGTVWLNCWMVRDLNMPFGGTKESGLGREGAQHSIDFFTEQKNICLKF